MEKYGKLPEDNKEKKVDTNTSWMCTKCFAWNDDAVEKCSCENKVEVSSQSD